MIQCIELSLRYVLPIQTAPGAHPASCIIGTGSFPVVKSGQGMMLTPHPLLVPWSWKIRAIPLLSLWAVRPVQSLSACTRVHFTFTCYRLSCVFSLYILPSLFHPLSIVTCIHRFLYTNTSWMARGGAVGWGTALQTGRSRDRFPKVPLEFFIYLIFPAALCPWSRLNL